MEQPARVPGEAEKEDFVDYTRVLGEYGGETERARAAYGKELYADMVGGLEIRDKIIGQSILIHGGAGYMADLPLEKLMRDAKMFEIGGGRERDPAPDDSPRDPRVVAEGLSVVQTDTPGNPRRISTAVARGVAKARAPHRTEVHTGAEQIVAGE